jgi:D-alanyl-D-alanine carboxypeptidase
VRRTICVSLAIALAITLSAASAGAAEARWKTKLRKLTRSRTMSIVVRDDRKILFERRSKWRRVPASNQKLLLSMALLDRLGPNATFRTRALAEPKPPPFVDAGEPDIRNGVLRSNLWIVGSGDPTFSQAGGGYGGRLSIEPTWVGHLVRALREAGVERVAGRVIGVRASPFRHDWDAPGWKPEFNDEEVALPSALSLDGNVHQDRFIDDPELRVARALTRALRDKGVRVKGTPIARKKPSGLTLAAAVESRRLAALLGHMNRRSSNFFAEVLGKALAVSGGRRPGTIAGGAAELRGWLRKRGVRVKAHDGSGLSYANAVSPRGIVRLLGHAERRTWGNALFRSLPKGGWGTLEDRLKDVRLRAKTGTLDRVSSLSGWLWLRRSRRWATFSIISNGRPTWDAKSAEDRIVRLVSRHY